MLDPQDQRENQEHRAGWVLLDQQDASSLDPRVMLVRVVLLVQLGRLATDFLVQRVTEEIWAPQVRSVPRETASPAPRVHLVCLDFQENPGPKAWASPDQRGILDSEGCRVYRDLRAKASKDLRVTSGDLVHQGQLGHRDKEFRGQRASRGPRACRARGEYPEKDFLELKVTEAQQGRGG